MKNSTDIEIVQRDTFNIIRSAINRAVDLIKPTYGPAKNKVIISRVLNKMVVDDGVQIARDLELPDALENAVWFEAKKVAITTNDKVGDGTTGALIILQAIIEEAAKIARFDGSKVEAELKKAFQEAKKKLLKSAIQVSTKDDLRKVARISFDDQKIADLIADTAWSIGKEGMITVDKSNTGETYADVAEGIKISRGYMSPYMITNPQRMEALIEKPYILITDYRLTEVNDILPIMNALAAKQVFNLVVFCEHMEQNAMATAIVNKMQGKFNLVAVNTPPDDGNILEDIAMMIGAKLFSQKKGDKLEEAKVDDLGKAERFIAHSKESVIVGPKGNKKVINKSILDLEAALAMETDEGNKDLLKKRIARFTNRVAVIKVGAATDPEANALKYKVDDAVNSVQAAMKSGVACGAGLALARLDTSSDMLNEALKAPFKQLKRNAGIEKHKELGKDEAINAVTGKIGNFLEVGVVDPVEVLIAQIESAVSMAGLLLTTSGIIVEPPKRPKVVED